MDDIRKQDLMLFGRELLSPWRVGAYVVLGFAARVLSIPGVVIVLAAIVTTAYNESVQRRFQGPRHGQLWEGCRDRLSRFEEVLKKMRRTHVADLSEMPMTIRSVAKSLYVALRRADMIYTEIHKTEKEFYGQAPAWAPARSDPQSQELYRLADKNIAEYRQQYAGIMAGVQRTEAQSAVFMTTVDTLRMKMLGYRLVGKSPELGSHEFLEALSEAKLQLQAIDKALDELDLGHYPKMIAAMPPAPASAVADEQHLGQNN